MESPHDGDRGGQRIRLRGEPLPPFPSMDEVIRPFEIRDRGITFLDGQDRTRLGYAEMAARAQSVAARMRKTGVAPGDRVAMTLANDLDSVLTLLGTWASGATVVSLPPQGRGSREWHASQFGAVLEAMGCEFLVPADDTQAVYQPRCSARSIALGEILRDADEPTTDFAAGVPPVALIQFTSGSVASPKGVTISAEALAGHLTSIAYISETDPAADKFVSWLPLYHDLGLVAMFLQALGSRSEQVLMPPRAFASRPARWLTALHTEGGTMTAAPNFAYRMAAAVPYPEGTDLSPVRVSINAGERVDWKVLTDFHKTSGAFGMKWGAVVPCYGLAESVVGAAYTWPGRGAQRHRSGHVSVGRPMPGVSIAAPAGPEVGPIFIAGSSLFEGYHTVGGFVSELDHGWFDTGDEGFIEDGDVYVVGRRAETVAVAGHNVFAEDIESVVHEKGGELVRACAAFRLKESDQKFGLMVEISPQAARKVPDIAEFASSLRAAVIEALGVRVAMLSLVRLGTIPCTTSGKVQRAECREFQSSSGAPHRLLLQILSGANTSSTQHQKEVGEMADLRIWMDGELVDWSNATVHVTSFGLNYGIGFFEGIRCYPTSEGPAIFRLDDHLRRLERSLAIYGVTLPYDVATMTEACRKVVSENSLAECYLRPIVFLGAGDSPLAAPFHAAVIATEKGPMLGPPKPTGVTARISSFERFAPSSIPPAAKATGQYLNSFLAQMEALTTGSDEALLLNADGQVADGWAHNVFTVSDGILNTPPTSVGALSGITRDSIMVLAAEHGIRVSERVIVRSDLYIAEECFLTGTAAGVVPVISVDGRMIGAGKPGPVTSQLGTLLDVVTRGKVADHADWRHYV
jgi:branched-chain amino acid aminotransferase group I